MLNHIGPTFLTLAQHWANKQLNVGSTSEKQCWANITLLGGLSFCYDVEPIHVAEFTMKSFAVREEFPDQYVTEKNRVFKTFLVTGIIWIYCIYSILAYVCILITV